MCFPALQIMFLFVQTCKRSPLSTELVPITHVFFKKIFLHAYAYMSFYTHMYIKPLKMLGQTGRRAPEAVQCPQAGTRDTRGSSALSWHAVAATALPTLTRDTSRMHSPVKHFCYQTSRLQDYQNKSNLTENLETSSIWETDNTYLSCCVP